MDLEDSLKILGSAIQLDGTLNQHPPLSQLYFDKEKPTVSLSGNFTPEQLEAVATYMRFARLVVD